MSIYQRQQYHTVDTGLELSVLGNSQNSNTHNLRGSATCLLHGATGLY